MSKAFAQRDDGFTPLRPQRPPLELICRTDSLAALRAAVDHGADSIRLRWRKEGPRVDSHVFQRVGLRKAVEYALAQECSVCLELEPQDELATPHSILARAFDSGISDVSLTSVALALYLRARHPDVEIRMHADDAALSARALSLLKLRVGLTRIILPRVVSLAQIHALGRIPGMSLEVHGWGAGCAIQTGRVTRGMASASQANAPVGGDPACNDSNFESSEFDRLMPLDLLAELHQCGVHGVIVEACSRSPGKMASLAGTWREAIDRHLPATGKASHKLVALSPQV